MRGRFSRDRGSFKSSEVVGLFIVSLICWMCFFVAFYAIASLIDTLFGSPGS